jgi:hypothetical protein
MSASTSRPSCSPEKALASLVRVAIVKDYARAQRPGKQEIFFRKEWFW